MVIDARGMSLTDYINLFWRIVFTDMGDTTRKLLYGSIILYIYFLIFGKGKERLFLGIQSLLLLVFCWNKWTMYYLANYLDLSSRYFRYLWIMPVAFSYGYFAVHILQRIKNKKARTALCYVVSFVALGIGARDLARDTTRLYNPFDGGQALTPIDNIYRIEEDTIQISELIAQDKGSPEASAKTLYGYDVFMDLRTYDASLYSGFTLGDQKKFRGASFSNEDLLNLFGEGNNKDGLNLLINGSEPVNEIKVAQTAVRDILKEEGFQYIIVDSNAWAKTFFAGCGETLGQSLHYTIVKVV